MLKNRKNNRYKQILKRTKKEVKLKRVRKIREKLNKKWRQERSKD